MDLIAPVVFIKYTGNIHLYKQNTFLQPTSKTNNLAILESKPLFCMPRNNWY